MARIQNGRNRNVSFFITSILDYIRGWFGCLNIWFFGGKVIHYSTTETDVSICYIFTNFKIAVNEIYFLITILEDFKGTRLSVFRFIKAL